MCLALQWVPENIPADMEPFTGRLDLRRSISAFPSGQLQHVLLNGEVAMMLGAGIAICVCVWCHGSGVEVLEKAGVERLTVTA